MDTFEVPTYETDKNNTEIVEGSDLKVGDGLWDVIRADGEEIELTNDRPIDEIRKIDDEGFRYILLILGPWQMDIHPGDKARITKRPT